MSPQGKQTEYNITLLILKVSFFIYFITVEVSFIYAGMWFIWYVTPYILVIFYPNFLMYTLANAGSASSLKVAHFVCNVRAAVLVLIPSEFVSVLYWPKVPTGILQSRARLFWQEKEIIKCAATTIKKDKEEDTF